ncbi:MAG: hypothetical protein KJ893_04125 [Candidatus Omnitrophica bacterium]|nr:hypothetical protein [Candidatus Omnitrophota bacterium]MBU4478767.1 hypothetical protein [Candidatus Omnitrophota bacterium]MCG2702888.1 hypothetical protein [Candidatus Omnitrophota bacterium]
MDRYRKQSDSNLRRCISFYYKKEMIFKVIYLTVAAYLFFICVLLLVQALR